jgi:hypothetical protein
MKNHAPLANAIEGSVWLAVSVQSKSIGKYNQSFGSLLHTTNWHGWTTPSKVQMILDAFANDPDLTLVMLLR